MAQTYHTNEKVNEGEKEVEKEIEKEGVEKKEIRIVECQFGMHCRKRPDCTFLHPKNSCRYGLKCRNRGNCSFFHPKPACKNGPTCSNKDSKVNKCPFFHPKPCSYGADCKNKDNCPYFHEDSKNISMHEEEKKDNKDNNAMKKDWKDKGLTFKSKHLIKQKLHKARLRVIQLQKLQNELLIAENELAKYGADKLQFSNYTQTKKITKTELVDADYHSTICSACNEVCHNNCSLKEITSQGANEFSDCECMDPMNEKCCVCTGRCSYTTHYHARKTMKTTEHTLEEILEDVKIKFDAAENGKQQQRIQVKSIENAKRIHRRALVNLKKSIKSSCKKLMRNHPGINLVDELYAMVRQLREESKNLRSFEAKKTLDDFITSIEKFSEKLSNPSEEWLLNSLSLKKTTKERPIKINNSKRTTKDRPTYNKKLSPPPSSSL